MALAGASVCTACPKGRYQKIRRGTIATSALPVLIKMHLVRQIVGSVSRVRYLTWIPINVRNAKQVHIEAVQTSAAYVSQGQFHKLVQILALCVTKVMWLLSQV